MTGPGRIAGLLFLGLTWAALVQADQVSLADGRTIYGEAEWRGDQLVVATKYGEVTFSRAEVLSVVDGVDAPEQADAPRGERRHGHKAQRLRKRSNEFASLGKLHEKARRKLVESVARVEHYEEEIIRFETMAAAEEQRLPPLREVAEAKQRTADIYRHSCSLSCNRPCARLDRFQLEQRAADVEWEKVRAQEQLIAGLRANQQKARKLLAQAERRLKQNAKTASKRQAKLDDAKARLEAASDEAEEAVAEGKLKERTQEQAEEARGEAEERVDRAKDRTEEEAQALAAKIERFTRYRERWKDNTRLVQVLPHGIWYHDPSKGHVQVQQGYELLGLYRAYGYGYTPCPYCYIVDPILR